MKQDVKELLVFIAWYIRADQNSRKCLEGTLDTIINF